MALRALGDFANGGSFPGGYTRSTLKKLAATRIPAYDAGVALGDYFELEGEHAAVEAQIGMTDRLIDRIVYRLYGLSEEEVAIVEGRSHNAE